MPDRVLVGYATRTGSTQGVAEEIARTLESRGFAVDLRAMRERPSLAGYNAAILGSAVNGAAWLPEAVTFVENNREALAAMPVTTFCVHIMNAGDTEKARKKRLAYLDKVRQLITPVEEGYYMGTGPDADGTSLITRWAFRAFGGSGEGDCRDWDEIRAWAERVQVVPGGNGL